MYIANINTPASIGDIRIDNIIPTANVTIAKIISKNAVMIEDL
jgi:hypothetical protein